MFWEPQLTTRDMADQRQSRTAFGDKQGSQYVVFLNEQKLNTSLFEGKNTISDDNTHKQTKLDAWTDKWKIIETNKKSEAVICYWRIYYQVLAF